MPRRPSTRRRRPTTHHPPPPVTFSSFSRSIAQMASASRRRPPPEPRQNPKPAGKDLVDSNVESSESSDEEHIVEGILSKEAVFCDPKPDDFHAVKTLLRTYLDVRQWDLSGFVDLILSQTTVGTFVKLDGDEDNWVYALLTVLNLHRYREHKCIAELKEFLVGACREEGVRGDLRSLLGEESQSVGLLVSQCMLNFPPLPPLYDGVFDEVSWATEDEPTEELRKSFAFKHYITITRIEKLRSTGKKMRQRGNNDEEIIYNKPEDEIFHKLSLWSFTFPWKTQELAPHESKKYQLMGLVMAIEAEKIPEVRQELHRLFDQP